MTLLFRHIFNHCNWSPIIMCVQIPWYIGLPKITLTNRCQLNLHNKHFLLDCFAWIVFIMPSFYLWFKLSFPVLDSLLYINNIPQTKVNKTKPKVILNPNISLSSKNVHYKMSANMSHHRLPSMALIQMAFKVVNGIHMYRTTREQRPFNWLV